MFTYLSRKQPPPSPINKCYFSLLRCKLCWYLMHIFLSLLFDLLYMFYFVKFNCPFIFPTSCFLKIFSSSCLPLLFKGGHLYFSLKPIYMTILSSSHIRGAGLWSRLLYSYAYGTVLTVMHRWASPFANE